MGAGDGAVIGVLSPFVGGAYYGTILAGISAAAAAAGSRTVAVQTLDSAADIAVNGGTPTFTAPVAWDHIAGFVVLADAVTGDYLDRLHAAGKPVVLLGHRAGRPDLTAVVADNGAGVRDAVTHLIEHGHRRIAFTGYVAASDIAERHHAYTGTLLAHGIEPDPALFLPATDNLESGVAGVDPRALRNTATAIVAATDRNATGLLTALTAAGFACPEDLAITGFDDIEVAAYLNPSLASVRQPLTVMAARAVDLLLRAVAGAPLPPGAQRVPTAFVPRGSCGCSDSVLRLPPPVADPGPARLTERLAALLPPGAVRTGEHLTVLAKAVDSVVDLAGAAAAGRPPDHAGATAALLALYALQAQPEGLRIVARAVQEYVQQVPAAGDELLVYVAERIRRSLRTGDKAARFGGDEFVVFLAEAERLDSIADRLRASIAAPYTVAGQLVRIGVSIGCTPCGDRATADEILSAADTAMYQAKTAAR
ncbi:GGDEF domain-containing protein [Dactylosporangium sp. NPDC006015]|uniref:GGDEF domain-containing protein n=1 Tax=Dactylosporangium sp. NPDC006015 TaxID=3154576 RepID=UPI0033B6A249